MSVKNMSVPDFRKINSGKSFESLCADILQAEGFLVESEPKVDRTGFDIHVIEEYKSHSGNSFKIKWKVQCKHFAESNKSLGRKEVEQYIAAYDCIRTSNTGLLFIIDTDYTEPAIEVIEKYTQSHEGARVMIWNARFLATCLERHPNIAFKYDLITAKNGFIEEFKSLSKYQGRKILIVSDQSNIAHNITSIFKFYNFDITFLPIWNYSSPTRLLVFASTVLKNRFDLIISFLGDSFEFEFPQDLCNLLSSASTAGTSLLFFPFFSFCTDKGLYKNIEKLLPVKLRPNSDDSEGEMVMGNLRFGDFSFFSNFEGFAEDQYTEIIVNPIYSELLPGITGSIYLKHTFEYIEAKAETMILLSNTVGNPILVINNNSNSKVAYFNTSTHSCLTTLPITSPIESSNDMAIVFNHLFNWLLSNN